MTFDFFEGAAGTGKTHNLVGRAGEIVQDGVLGEGHKLLALTFMNGARRRLDAIQLRGVPARMGDGGLAARARAPAADPFVDGVRVARRSQP